MEQFTKHVAGLVDGQLAASIYGRPPQRFGRALSFLFRGGVIHSLSRTSMESPLDMPDAVWRILSGGVG